MKTGQHGACLLRGGLPVRPCDYEKQGLSVRRCYLLGVGEVTIYCYYLTI